jgi:hypothetical protein
LGASSEQPVVSTPRRVADAAAGEDPAARPGGEAMRAVGGATPGTPRFHRCSSGRRDQVDSSAASDVPLEEVLDDTLALSAPSERTKAAGGGRRFRRGAHYASAHALPVGGCRAFIRDVRVPARVTKSCVSGSAWNRAELQVITGHRPKEPPLIFNKNTSIECLSIIAPRIFNTHVK